MTWTLTVLLLAVMAMATPHSQASPSVDAEEPLGDYGTDQWWWSSPPPVALQCCRLPDKGLDPHNFDLHHLLHHHPPLQQSFLGLKGARLQLSKFAKED